MNLAQLNESGFKSTQAEIKRFNTLLAQQYKEALDEIRADTQALYNKITAKFTPVQLGKILETNPAFLYTESLKFDRLQALQKKVQTQFVKASIAAGNMTVESSKMAISNNFYRQQFGVMFANASPVNLSFTVLNPAVVEISVLGTPTVWKKIGKDAAERIGKKYGDLSKYQPKHGSLTSTILNNRVKDLQKIQSSITQGLIQGKSFTQTAKDVKNVLNTTASNALRVVRTESMRNMNAGAFANHNQSVSQGLEMDRQILSVLDGNTRPQSVQVDTDIADEEGFFLYPGGLLVSFPGNSGVAAFDINDRETVIEIIDGQSPELRRGRNPLTGKNEVMSFKSYPDWMADNGFKQNPTGRWALVAKPKPKVTRPPVPTKPKVVKANTIKEAEDFAVNNINGLKTVKYRGLSVDTANEINKTMFTSQNKYGDLGVDQLTTFSQKKSGTMMSMDFKSNVATGGVTTRLSVNTSRVGGSLKDVNELLSSANNSGWQVSRNVNDLVIHELGHSYTFKGKSFNAIIKQESILETINLGTPVSRYAGTSNVEALSEGFVLLDRGEEVTAEMRKAIIKNMELDI